MDARYNRASMHEKFYHENNESYRGDPAAKFWLKNTGFRF